MNDHVKDPMAMQGTYDQQPHSRVWRLGEQIDTDALAPGAYMKFDLATIAKHTLGGVRSDFASGVQPGDVIAAGQGFGVGSSREQAAGVLVHLGLRAVIAPSYSGLFFRNAFNLGLLLLTCPRALELEEGQQIKVIGQRVWVDQHHELPCEPIPEFLMDMVRLKGLVNVLKLRKKSSV
jgi:3-isopropylmalate/(R)-2-methylmalate dehydratase small subunit